MGASSWSYSVPYREDVNKAFEELRQRTYENGAYYKAWALFLEEDELEDEAPRSLEELLEMNGTDRTHSILDMEQVAAEPLTKGEKAEIGTVYPLAVSDLVSLFGTSRPGSLMVEALEQQNPKLQIDQVPGVWHGIYFTVYKDDMPDVYYFTGYSGDY